MAAHVLEGRRFVALGDIVLGGRSLHGGGGRGTENRSECISCQPSAHGNSLVVIGRPRGCILSDIKGPSDKLQRTGQPAPEAILPLHHRI